MLSGVVSHNILGQENASAEYWNSLWRLLNGCIQICNHYMIFTAYVFICWMGNSVYIHNSYLLSHLLHWVYMPKMRSLLQKINPICMPCIFPCTTQIETQAIPNVSFWNNYGSNRWGYPAACYSTHAVLYCWGWDCYYRKSILFVILCMLLLKIKSLL